MARTLITGTVEFINTSTGAVRDHRVRFEADSEDEWVEIVDRACEIAELRADFPAHSAWQPSGEDTLSEEVL